jgi:hypothetical protein
MRRCTPAPKAKSRKFIRFALNCLWDERMRRHAEHMSFIQISLGFVGESGPEAPIRSGTSRRSFALGLCLPGVSTSQRRH